MSARSIPIRPCNDNRSPRDLTNLTLMAFGPGLIIALVVTALFLASVWS
ncbi:hypothetical protein G3T14_21325 [Methylobacterium sp. BTF04]|nr:hypothetical protein [Methylobacterium sp. BTF04]NEU14628.1 hypothetical protein [Methylobacterium sp. BTF04]